MIQSSPNTMARFNRTVTAARSRNAAAIPSRRPRSSPWPKRREKTVPLPIASPSRMEVRKVISVKDDPTAARASSPRKRPTISVSAML